MNKIGKALRPLTVPIAGIRPDPENARLHPERNLDAIKASLRKFGQQKPIVVSAEGIAIAGNGVLQAAMELGWTEIAAVRSALKAKELRAYAIADNRTGELSEWDEDRLAEQLRDLAAAAIDMDSIGFNIDEIADILHQAAEPAVPEPAEEESTPISKAGQIYRLGRHRLLCGDSTTAESYQRILGRNRAQLAVTSPPYGVGKNYEEQGIEPWFATIRPVIENLCARADVVVWNIGDLYTTGGQFIEPTFSHSLTMFAAGGYKPLWVRIWRKPGFNYGLNPYHTVTNKPVQQYEYIGAFGSDEDGVAIMREDFCGTDFEWIVALAGAKYRYVRRLSARQRRAWGYAGVWEMNTVSGEWNHPAMFPLELPLRAILMHSDRDATILEPFCGSGTTILAAEQSRRKCVAIELSERFCDVARQRWAEMVHGEECDWPRLTPAADGQGRKRSGPRGGGDQAAVETVAIADCGLPRRAGTD